MKAPIRISPERPAPPAEERQYQGPGRAVAPFLERFWLFFLPPLFLPNLGFGSETPLGLAKLAKLTLYGIAGMLMVTRVRDAKKRREFHWSLLGLGVSLVVGPGKEEEKRAFGVASTMGYKSNNAASVTVAIVTCYVGVLLASRYGSKRWRCAAISRYLKRFHFPSAYVRLLLSVVSYAVHYRKFGVLDAGWRGIVPGHQHAKQPRLCSNYKVAVRA